MIQLRRGALKWDEIVSSFTHTFGFVDDHPSIDVALQVIKTKIFEDIPMSMTNFNHSSTTIQHQMECYNVTGEPDEDEPLDVNIYESEGTCAVEDLVFLETNF